MFVTVAAPLLLLQLVSESPSEPYNIHHPRVVYIVFKSIFHLLILVIFEITQQQGPTQTKTDALMSYTTDTQKETDCLPETHRTSPVS